MKRFILMAVVVACIGCRAKEKTKEEMLMDIYGRDNVEFLKKDAARFKAHLERRQRVAEQIERSNNAR